MHDHRVAGREVDARGERDLVAEVPREPDEREARIVAAPRSSISS